MKSIVTKEQKVRAVLDKVVSKEVDAGFAYLTDTYQAKEEVKMIAIPNDISITPAYPIAVLRETGDKELAKAFVDYLISKTGSRDSAKVRFCTEDARGGHSSSNENSQSTIDFSC